MCKLIIVNIHIICNTLLCKHIIRKEQIIMSSSTHYHLYINTLSFIQLNWSDTSNILFSPDAIIVKKYIIWKRETDTNDCLYTLPYRITIGFLLTLLSTHTSHRRSASPWHITTVNLLFPLNSAVAVAHLDTLDNNETKMQIRW